MAHSGHLAPYFKPSLPFSGPIHGGLHDGLMVIISGTVLPACDRFQIDFQCGPSPYPQADIIFHFNPRFEKVAYVVCNTFKKKCWGREERRYEMAFFKGHPFEIRVLVKSDSFLVAVNGNPFVQYNHRIPFSRGNYIRVSGGVDVAIISFQDTASLCAWCPRAAGITNAAFLLHSSLLDQHTELVYTMQEDRSGLCDFSYVNNVAEVNVLRSTYRSISTAVCQQETLSPQFLLRFSLKWCTGVDARVISGQFIAFILDTINRPPAGLIAARQSSQ